MKTLKFCPDFLLVPVGRWRRGIRRPSPVLSAHDMSGAGTANGIIVRSLSMELTPPMRTSRRAHCTPVLRAGDIMPARVTTCCRAVCAIPPKVLQQTGPSESQYSRTSFSPSRVFRHLKTLKFCPDFLLVPGGRWRRSIRRPSPALSAHDMSRAGTANGIIVRSISRELTPPMCTSRRAHCAPVLREGDIMPARVITCCRAVCAISPEVLQQTGPSESQYPRTSFSPSRVFRHLKTLKFCPDFLLVPGGRWRPQPRP